MSLHNGPIVLLVLLVAPLCALAQNGVPVPDALADAVRRAVLPALPYPPAALDDMPADGRADSPWLLRRHDGASEALLEVIANPLNAESQAQAAKAMSDIRAAVTEAERRAQDEYERSIGTTSREHPTRELAGISLDDEGAAGARADWDRRLVVAVRSAQPRYTWTLDGPGVLSRRVVPGGVAFVADAAEYDDPSAASQLRRYRPAEARVYFGTTMPTDDAAPSTSGSIEVVAETPSRSIEITLKGNAALLEQVLLQSDWSRVAAFAK